MSDEELFASALRIQETADRLAYLDQACAGNAEQRARVARLLAALDDAGSFLNKPLADIAAIEATVAAGGTQAASTDHSGQASAVVLDFLTPSDDPRHLGKLGPYAVEEVIGRGGMGVVLKAIDPKLNRVVAIKVLAREMLSNPMAGKRFRREAQAAAAVSHDHVVRIYAVDDESPVPFLVMECIVGQSLQQKIDRKGALELREILRIGMQIASGLAAAHKQGLVHRDIKPANILLENGIERVKITDFGLARAVDDVGFTQSGQVTGTPQYMSPEQALGEQVDHRSDLFSLGSVLYTMCTGRPAFRATSTVAMLRRVVDDAPRPISEINPEVPDWLVAIIDRLMAKKPEDRMQSATEVADLLGQHLAHLQEPQRAPKPAAVARPAVAKPAAAAPSRPIPVPVWISLALVGGMLLLFPLSWTGILQPSGMKGASDLLLTLTLLCIVTFILLSGVQRIRRGAWRQTMLGSRPLLSVTSLVAMFVLNNIFFTRWQASPWIGLEFMRINSLSRLIVETDERDLKIDITPQNGQRIGVSILPHAGLSRVKYDGLLQPGNYLVSASKGSQKVYSKSVFLARDGSYTLQIPLSRAPSDPPLSRPALDPKGRLTTTSVSVSPPHDPAQPVTAQAAPSSNAVVNDPQPARSAAVIEELKKQVELAAKELEIMKARHQAAQVSMFEVRSAEQAWNIAQLRLAEAEGNKKAVIGFARTLVKLSEEKVAIAQELVKRAVVSPADLRSAEKELSEAKLRFAELDSDNPIPPVKPGAPMPAPGAVPDKARPALSAAVKEELQKQINLAEQALKVAQASHQAGQATQLDLMNAERDLIMARQRFCDAEGLIEFGWLKELIALLEKKAKFVRQQIEIGTVPQSELNAVEKELSDTRIRIQEAKPKALEGLRKRASSAEQRFLTAKTDVKEGRSLPAHAFDAELDWIRARLHVAEGEEDLELIKQAYKDEIRLWEQDLIRVRKRYANSPDLAAHVKSNEFWVNRVRLSLAEAEGNREAAREPARFLVKVAEERVEHIRKKVEAEQEPPVKLVEAEKELQEAKARLANAETDRPEAPMLPQP